MGLDDLNVGDLANKALDVLTKPLTDKLNQQIDKLAIQSRQKLAAEGGTTTSAVTDLAVAEYLAGIPTARLTEEVSSQMQYVAKSARNGLIIGLGFIAIAILFSSMIKSKHKNV